MTPSYRFYGSFCPLAALTILISGCAPTRSEQFRTSFLPPAPAAVAASPGTAADDTLLSEPLPATANAYFLKATPTLLPVTFTAPRNAETESRIQRAEEHYAAGQKAYQAGDMDEARREFNRAVDLLLTAPDNVPDRQRIERRLDQMVDAVYRYDVNGLGSGDEGDKVVYDKSPLDGILEMTFPMDPRLRPKVKEEIHATSSELPLDANDSVLSYIHFFSSDQGRKVLSYGIKRSGRYRPMIQRVLQEEGVPQELIYLAQIESAFSPRAVSVKSCVGLWQFSSWDGKANGLRQTQWADERMDPEKSTRAAAKLLRGLYNQFGDWYLAMAGFNCGPACVDRAVQRTGYADFWKLRDIGALPKETTNYVPVIVAITIMAKNPKDYGLDHIDLEPFLDYETVRVTANTNLALVADAIEKPVAEVKDLNPALLHGVAPEGYELRLPIGTGEVLSAALENIPANRRNTWRMHRVEPGETLAGIAKRFGAAPAAIIAANNNVVDAPSAGDLLAIPATYDEMAVRPVPVRRASLRTRRTTAARPSLARAGKTARPPTAKQTGVRVSSRRTPGPAHKVAETRRVPARILTRKATVKTAQAFTRASIAR